jgi:hypothetical protein
MRDSSPRAIAEADALARVLPYSVITDEKRCREILDNVPAHLWTIWERETGAMKDIALDIIVEWMAKQQTSKRR